MKAYLSLGSNLGSVVTHLAKARELLKHDKHFTVLRASSLYMTEPVNTTKRLWFANQMVSIETTYTPTELLLHTQSIERKMGRTKKGDNSPRVIDIDIIGYGNKVVNESNLIIPHPRMQERLFVLVPLHEIAPRWKHPETKETVSVLRDRLTIKMNKEKNTQHIRKLDLAGMLHNNGEKI